MPALFDWTPEKIEYYRRASDYTGFFRKLVELALPFFDAEDEVVDLGCGLGLFDVLLAPYVRHIEAIDVHPYAIAYLKCALVNGGITNVDAVLSDTADYIVSGAVARALDGGETRPTERMRVWDVIFMSFFGEASDTFNILLRQARKRVVMITHNDDK
ncbi:MAG: methyltransferase, partial [Clostridiales Family XIII bacterium]|nr:methyltransferase [Clostridiales Family XIII bacterium]